MTGDENDPLAATAARLAALPAVAAALRQYTFGLAHFRQGPRLLNKLLSQDTRWRVIGYLLYLHADRASFGPNGGATYGRLLELCTRRQEASPRVLKTMLALLHLAGFVETTRSPLDKRSKFYHPTARMLGFIKRWLAYPLGALDILEPELERMRALAGDPGFIERFLVSGGRDFISGAPPTERMPEFAPFFRQEGAYLMLVVVMLADIDGTPLPSRGEIAKRFGLSKTQVTNNFVLGAAHGFLVFDAEAAPVPTPLLRRCYERWVSLELAYYARHARPLLCN